MKRMMSFALVCTAALEIAANTYAFTPVDDPSQMATVKMDTCFTACT